jgi:hypothetical protein
MTIPSNVALFRFPGYGPDLGDGLLVQTQAGKVLITEAVTNPGVPLVDSISPAVQMAGRVLGKEVGGFDVYVWTPDDPLEPDALWQLTFSDGTPAWRQVDWRSDDDLRSGVVALKRAAGREQEDARRNE